MALTRELIAIKICKEELYEGITVNLGAGMPAIIFNYLPPNMEVLLQAENGVLGYGASPELNAIDHDVMNAAGYYVTLLPGGSFFPSHVSFNMITGGHIDLGILGGFQVSEKGDLANWIVPERKFGSIGGAMNVAAGVKRLIVMMEHVDNKGRPKILNKCTYPLTAKGCVNRIYTDFAVIDVTPEGLVLLEVAPDITPEEVESHTEPKLIRAPDLKEMEF